MDDGLKDKMKKFEEKLDNIKAVLLYMTAVSTMNAFHGSGKSEALVTFYVEYLSEIPEGKTLTVEDLKELYKKAVYGFWGNVFEVLKMVSDAGKCEDVEAYKAYSNLIDKFLTDIAKDIEEAAQEEAEGLAEFAAEA